MLQLPGGYRPIQLNHGIHYSEIQPSAHLKPYIACFWRIENRSERVAPYLIIPDGTVDLISDLYGDRQLRVSVAQAGPAQLPLPPFSTVWGLRFYPSVFTTFFQTPMTELADTMWLDFTEICRATESAYLAEKLAEGYDLEWKKAVFESFFEKYLRRENFASDHRFLNVLDRIYLENGNLRLEKERRHGISPRQLRRVFDAYIGFSPKAFSRIVQLQHAVQGLRRKDYSWFDSGFYDQAHFIREIKGFTGMTPRQLQTLLHEC